MAAKKSESDPVAGSGSAQELIEQRRKAKEEAVDQTGVEPPAPVDVNEPVENPETRP